MNCSCLEVTKILESKEIDGTVLKDDGDTVDDEDQSDNDQDDNEEDEGSEAGYETDDQSVED